MTPRQKRLRARQRTLGALDPKLRKYLLRAQRSELTEAAVYERLARLARTPANRQLLKKIAAEERAHAGIWAEITQRTLHPRRLRVWLWSWVASIFGLTFGVRFMERGEEQAQKNYEVLLPHFPETKQVIEDEQRHEKELIKLLNEKQLEYVGSVVLGLNDALVELTGALAGLSFALQDTRLVALAGLITGIAASFSMAASEYLSKRNEKSREAGKSALYTGVAYLLTVILLVLPFFLFDHYLHALAGTISVVILVIAGFNFYISVAKAESFWKRFGEMALISLGVAALSFGIGVIVRLGLGIEV